MKAIILAGGSGKRFWPMSQKSFPKQFIKLFNDKSMIQLTVERLLHIFTMDDIFIVTVADQVELITHQIPDINLKNIIVEPFGMNTAPCIALSIVYISNVGHDNEELLILPADHYIPQTEEFVKYIKSGLEASKKNILITFGVQPTYPATGFGYIELGDEYSDLMFHVKHFKEKPNLQLANTFLKTGNYFWNSGMFCWNLKTIIEAFNTFEPEMLRIAEEVVKNNNNEIYNKMTKKSIDIAIMEKAKNVVVLPVDYKWSDVGNWRSFSDLMLKDGNNNYFKDIHLSFNSKNNCIFSNKKVAIIGVENLIVVETDDALLIVKNDSCETVKEINF